MFKSIFDDGISGVTVQQMLLCISCSLLLGLAIALIHMYKNCYTKNFIVTLTLLPSLIQIIIFLVNGNLGTGVAILGAFSLIRFRSKQGTARDIASIFWSLSIGLAIGTGFLLFSIFIYVPIALMQLLLYKFSFGNPSKKMLLERELTIRIKQDFKLIQMIKVDIRNNVTILDILEINVKNNLLEVHFNLLLPNVESEKRVFKLLIKKYGVTDINMVCCYNKKKYKTL